MPTLKDLKQTPCTNTECGFHNVNGRYWNDCIYSNAGPESRHWWCEDYAAARAEEQEDMTNKEDWPDDLG